VYVYWGFKWDENKTVRQKEKEILSNYKRRMGYKLARQSTNMVKYIIKRILIMIPMLLLALITTWILANMMAVDPILNKVGFADPSVLELERQRVGYYDPWFVKLGIYLKNFLSGDWGESYIVREGRSVLTLIGDIFPKTIELMIIPTILGPIIATKLGASAARHKDKRKDSIIRFIAVIGAAFPVFWFAQVIQIGFGVYVIDFTNGQLDLPILGVNRVGYRRPGPIGGFKTGFRIIDSIIYNDQVFLWDTILHLFLPALVMVFISLAGLTALTRSSMLEVLDQDYIRTARAKGVEEDKVINKHALRNALLPSSDKIIGGSLGALLGSLFIETVFAYEGFGYFFIQSLLAGDYLLINGLTVFAVIFTLTGTLVADVMYTIIDPRITYK
jgi:peptide/nickel transport system permease protein